MQITLLQPRLSRNDHAANLRAIRAAVCGLRTDLLVLPELWYRDSDLIGYEAMLRELATQTGACVVGGSLHAERAGRIYNMGAVVTPEGECLAHYTKQHPYGDEHARGVSAGHAPTIFEWRSWRYGVLICADAWDASLWRAPQSPAIDCWCIVAESVSEEHTPAQARTLWRSLAIARAYECASYVAISDWAEGPLPEGGATCGVSGWVDPTVAEVQWQGPAPGCQAASFSGDLARLAAHRQRRSDRNFLRA